MTFNSRFLPLPRCDCGYLRETSALSQAPCVTEQIPSQRGSCKPNAHEPGLPRHAAALARRKTSSALL